MCYFIISLQSHRYLTMDSTSLLNFTLSAKLTLKGMTRSVVANHLDVTPPYLSQLLNGKRSMTNKTTRNAKKLVGDFELTEGQKLIVEHLVNDQDKMLVLIAADLIKEEIELTK